MGGPLGGRGSRMNARSKEGGRNRISCEPKDGKTRMPPPSPQEQSPAKEKQGEHTKSNIMNLQWR